MPHLLCISKDLKIVCNNIERDIVINNNFSFSEKFNILLMQTKYYIFKNLLNIHKITQI